MVKESVIRPFRKDEKIVRQDFESPKPTGRIMDPLSAD
jgi:hypothetical protein